MKIITGTCVFLLLAASLAWAGERAIDFTSLMELRAAVSEVVGAVIRDPLPEEKMTAAITCHMRSGEGSRVLGVVDTNRGLVIACAPPIESHLKNEQALDFICARLGFKHHRVNGPFLICSDGRGA